MRSITPWSLESSVRLRTFSRSVDVIDGVDPSDEVASFSGGNAVGGSNTVGRRHLRASLSRTVDDVCLLLLLLLCVRRRRTQFRRRRKDLLSSSSSSSSSPEFVTIIITAPPQSSNNPNILSRREEFSITTTPAVCEEEDDVNDANRSSRRRAVGRHSTTRLFVLLLLLVVLVVVAKVSNRATTPPDICGDGDVVDVIAKVFAFESNKEEEEKGVWKRPHFLSSLKLFFCCCGETKKYERTQKKYGKKNI